MKYILLCAVALILSASPGSAQSYQGWRDMKCGPGTWLCPTQIADPCLGACPGCGGVKCGDAAVAREVVACDEAGTCKVTEFHGRTDVCPAGSVVVQRVIESDQVCAWPEQLFQPWERHPKRAKP